MFDLTLSYAIVLSKLGACQKSSEMVTYALKYLNEELSQIIPNLNTQEKTAFFKNPLLLACYSSCGEALQDTKRGEEVFNLILELD